MLNRGVGFLRRHAIGLLALFVAIGGTSYAALRIPAQSVGQRQLKPRSVGSTQLRDKAVTSRKLSTGAKGVLRGGLGAGALMGRVTDVPTDAVTTPQDVFGPVSGFAAADADKSKVSMVSPPVAVVARNLGVSQSAPMPTNTRRTITLIVNGAQTNLQCGIAAGASTCQRTDPANAVTISPNSTVAVGVETLKQGTLDVPKTDLSVAMIVTTR